MNLVCSAWVLVKSLNVGWPGNLEKIGQGLWYSIDFCWDILTCIADININLASVAVIICYWIDDIGTWEKKYQGKVTNFQLGSGVSQHATHLHEVGKPSSDLSFVRVVTSLHGLTARQIDRWCRECQYLSGKYFVTR